MVEIICPKCDEANGIHVEDFEFQPVADGDTIQAPVDCAYCNHPLTLVIALRVKRRW